MGGSAKSGERKVRGGVWGESESPRQLREAMETRMTEVVKRYQKFIFNFRDKRRCGAYKVVFSHRKYRHFKVIKIKVINKRCFK